MTPLLEVTDLHTSVGSNGTGIEIVRGVSLQVAAGETVAVVGESGCGKSFTALSIAGLLPESATVTSGSVRLEGQELLHLSEAERRQLRGAGIAMVYQDPSTSLNPMMRIGQQVLEAVLAHGWDRDEARERTLTVLKEVGLPQPAKVARAYPHQLSGGMRQRVLIAAALAPRPKVLIADEPTTALDVTIQRQILDMVTDLRDEYGIGVVWITHDLGVVARVADRVLVMYAGRLVESAPTGTFFTRPTHPYSAGLLSAIPVPGHERGPLAQIGGAPPAPTAALELAGCRFAPRCPQRVERCAAEEPPLLARGGSRAACWVPPEEWV